MAHLSSAIGSLRIAPTRLATTRTSAVSLGREQSKKLDDFQPSRFESIEDRFSGELKPTVTQSKTRKISAFASYWTRRIALNIASPVASILGTGFGVSPARLTGADKLHKQGIDGRGVRVAILDQAFTKFGAGSEDVLGVYSAKDGTYQEGLKKSDSDPARDIATKQKGLSFHGNAMACIVTGESWGLKGVAPGAEVLGVSIINDERQLTPELFLKGLEWVSEHHQDQNIKAVSASVNYHSPSEEVRRGAQALVDKLQAEGVTVVVAAGNRGPREGSISFPADLDNVVSVGAITQGLSTSSWDDRLEGYSSRGGNGVPGPKLLAPGGEIFTKDDQGIVELTKGTSNSAPMVASAIALLSQGFPEATSQEKVDALYSTAEVLTGDTNSEGFGAMRLLDAYQSLSASYSS